MSLQNDDLNPRIDFLTSVELFDDFDENELRALAEVFEPTLLAAGQELMAEGSASDSFHLVVQGRLRALTETESGFRRRGEIGRGEPLGEMGLLTGSPRSATVVAVRDSELLTMGADRFDELVSAHPGLIRKLAASIIQRSRDEATRPDSSAPVSVLVIPIDEQSQSELESFVDRLSAELRLLGDSVATLGPTSVYDDLLPLERNSDRVVFTQTQHGSLLKGWVQVADSVLLLSSAHPVQASGISPELVAALSHPALDHKDGVELVLNHKSGTNPSGTRRSLEELQRAGISAGRHHHVSVDDGRGLGQVARLVTQRAVGLVLGGGGARGLAHIGVIDELLDRDIPIDAIIGTSAGAIVAGGFGVGYDRDNQVQYLVDHLTKSPMDYTLPSAALASGRRITQLCKDFFGEVQIEDLWIDTSSVSTNLTQDCLAVHDSGPLWRAIRASLSIPVLFPPLRIGEDIHVDGALGANVPIRQLTDRHAGITVIASDVGIDKTLGSDQLANDGVTSVVAGLKQWLPFLEAEGPSVIRLIGRMVELSTGYGDQPEPALLIKHDLNDLPLFGFDRSFETADRGREAAKRMLTGFTI